MSGSSQRSRFEARQLFEQHFARTGDAKAAARTAGVSERTGRRWRAMRAMTEVTQDSAARRCLGGPRLIGREADSARVRELFRSGVRIVTLFGPPGIGKTRLAQHLIEEEVRQGRSAFFCDLRATHTANGMCVALGRAMGLETFSGGKQVAEAVPALGSALARQTKCLLVMDNFEQLVDEGSGVLSRWLSNASNVRFLVTSRRALRLREETLHEVMPLALPEVPETHDEDGDWSNDSMRLFCERARDFEPSFRPSPLLAESVAQLVRQLEGNPLAIELAAGQMRRTGPRELLARLDATMLELSHPSRNIEEGHSTLERAIETSWSLLSNDAQVALARLSVFRGGFTWEAASHVLLQRSDESFASVGDLLSELRDSSLLQATREPSPAGERRWDIFDSIRRFGAARIAAKDPSNIRHATYYLEWGERLIAKTGTRDGDDARGELAHELDNLLAAFDRTASDDETPSELKVPATSASGADPARIARLALVIYEAVNRWMPALCLEPLNRAVTVIERDSDTIKPNRELSAQVYLARGTVQRELQRHEQAIHDFQAARAQLKSSENLLAKIECEEIKTAFSRGGYQRALTRTKALLEKVSEAEHPQVAAEVHRLRARLLFEGGLDRSAIRHGSRALELVTSLGCTSEAAEARVTLAATRIFFGESIDELQLAADVETLRRQRELGQVAMGLSALGLHYQEGGRLGLAMDNYRKSLDVAKRSGNAFSRGVALLRIANCLDEEQHSSRARAAYEDAIAQCRSSGCVRNAALARIFFAGLLARLGETASAEDQLQSGRQLLETLGRTGLEDLVELQTAFLDIACAKRMQITDEHQADRYRRRAEARVAKARKSVARQDGTSTLPLAHTSPEARFILRMLDRTLASAPAILGTLWIASDGSSFEIVPGKPVEVPGGKALCRLLASLSRARRENPGQAMNHERLFASGWPGERIHRDAATKRVREGVYRLRRLGLGGMLKTKANGYLLDPQVTLSTDDSALESADGG